MVFEQVGGKGLSAQQKLAYIQAWSQPGAVEGMLHYYRNMPQLAAENSPASSNKGPQRSLKEMTIPQIYIKVPTLVMWGMQDKAFVPELLEGLGEYVSELHEIRFHTSARAVGDGV